MRIFIGTFIEERKMRNHLLLIFHYIKYNSTIFYEYSTQYCQYKTLYTNLKEIYNIINQYILLNSIKRSPMKKLFTSESVTEGHPDKICDQISDAILDAYLEKDTEARVACECAVKAGKIIVIGEVRSRAAVDIPEIARKILTEIGYTNESYGFPTDEIDIIVLLNEQSPDIAMGVDSALENRYGKRNSVYNTLGAGDQGMMFGFACEETIELMPMPIILAHKLTKQLSKIRKKGDIDWLRPDGKAQVTVEYDNDKPVRIESIVVSAQHNSHIKHSDIEKEILEKVIKATIPTELIDRNTSILVNPTGRFVYGGPKADSGLTGRKIMVDTYGGYSRHGGGSFSGKDPSKVDRSAAYMARYIAKNIVNAKLAKKCEFGLAYAIGVANPVSIMLETFGTGEINDEEIMKIINNAFDLRPAAILDHLCLKQPIYRQTATYGHFGREDIFLPWEETNIASFQ